ncbi:putative amidohydrolase YtcJ [Alkalibacillus filiformis]|uniref:Amidohydrolase YtcJ n=1 Tax=Alkalibacillus filiformis TaxID=200990 RepID=A0ABU0DS40_9BACI|nr:amidohydrolase [Alkalibacillus filiformis]MDQ0351263.1 putative amidohydrolase YtcJ [Alkalibacillus filiformis]
MGKMWYGGTIYTMDREGETVEAIYEVDGKIADMGAVDQLMERYNEEIIEKVVFDGVMLPGFIDSHLHIIGHGERLIRLDITYAHSREDLLNKVSDYANSLDHGKWLIAEGFNENHWDEPEVIHRDELDAICPNHPVILTRVCRHAMVANSKAMELAGIDELTEEPDGGVIEKDDQGRLTGYFHDQAQELLKEAMPEPNQAYLERAINASIDDLLSYGLVSGHSEDLSYYGGYGKTVQAFHNTIKKDQRFRAHLLVHHEIVEDYVEDQGKGHTTDDWLEFGAMKLFVDGALGGRTALLSQAYHDDQTTNGVAIHTDEELENLIQQARSYDMAVAVHVIGDLATEKVLNTIEANPPKQGLKDRIIHAQIMRSDIIERMKQLPIIIDIQPTFVSSDFPWAIERVGYSLIKTSYPWKTYLEEGILCAGGSDAPIEEVSPINGIAASVNRRSMFDGNIYLKDESLSVYEAIKLYTVNPAQVINKQDVQGKINPGYLADFVILDNDPFKVEESKLETLKVLQTIVNGKVVYDDQAVNV